MKKKTIIKTLILAVTILFVIVLCGFSIRTYNRYRYHVEKQTRFMMDTFVTIYTVGPKSQAKEAIRAAFERMQAIDSKFNSQNSESSVYAFNTQGTPITDPEIIDVVRQAVEISRLSGGAFDITIAPLIELWGFYGDNPSLPSDIAVKTTLKNIGYDHLHIEGGVVKKDNEAIKIDLGGIAKGYAVREGSAILKEHGVKSAMIDAGGDIYALGKRRRELWKIGIRNPRSEDILAIVRVANAAVMGSGDYHRYFMHNQKRYHHIFDPHTGYPAEGVIGTTLIHSDPMTADAWNTAIFILGPEKGLSIVERIRGMEAVMITSDERILYTTGLTDRIELVAQ